MEPVIAFKVFAVVSVIAQLVMLVYALKMRHRARIYNTRVSTLEKFIHSNTWRMTDEQLDAQVLNLLPYFARLYEGIGVLSARTGHPPNEIKQSLKRLKTKGLIKQVSIFTKDMNGRPHFQGSAYIRIAQ